jgi:exoribonuclease-2
MPHAGFDLAACAREEMLHEGFQPDFAPGTEEQLAAIRDRPAPARESDMRDLRGLLWSSIDNDTSRDLDQIEWAERTADGIRVLVGIADVDSDVPRKTPIDQHAADQTTTVYTEVRTFPMLPEELSTGLTSLNEQVDRLAVVVEMTVAKDGSIASPAIYRAVVCNKAQLTYDGVGGWLEGSAAAPTKVAASADLQTQLRLQDEAAQALHEKRHELGALDFDRNEAQAVIRDGAVTDIRAHCRNRATQLIEDFMVAANEAMARTLANTGVAAIRRVVKSPERWPRIVELAAQHGTKLPAEADSRALAAFLTRQQQSDPLHYPDLSLSVIKLMGPGEYVVARPGEEAPGHFGLAAHDYTHSTAPNRRFADLVTQRLIKASLAKQGAPYSDSELDSIASNCTLKEDAARKVERAMQKRVAAVALQNRIGQAFDAVVTGVTPKGVFVRIFKPPVEGRLMRGEHGLDVGDRLRVTLLSTDPQRGFIDFARG